MSNTDPDQKQQGWRPTAAQIIGAVIVIIAVVFIAENGRKTKIRFVGPEVTTWLWLALLVAALLGFIAGLLVSRHRRH